VSCWRAIVSLIGGVFRGKPGAIPDLGPGPAFFRKMLLEVGMAGKNGAIKLVAGN
jgi:hypothetical protein